MSIAEEEGFIQVNRKGEYDGQCVSFVKAIADFTKGTAYWSPGARVDAKNIKFGTAIAHFNGRAYGKHAAIYLGRQGDSIYVIDQNWYGKYVSIHPIKFKDENSGLDESNAYAYYVIE